MKIRWLLNLLLPILLSGCQQEPADISPRLDSEFTFENSTTGLTNAFVVGGFQNRLGTYQWTIYLTTAGITKKDGGLTGQGDYLLFKLNADSRLTLRSGTYNWSNVSSNFTLVSTSSLYQDFDLNALTGSVININDGTVKVTMQGEEITVEFNLTVSGSRALTGQYQGSLVSL